MLKLSILGIEAQVSQLRKINSLIFTTEEAKNIVLIDKIDHAAEQIDIAIDCLNSAADTLSLADAERISLENDK